MNNLTDSDNFINDMLPKFNQMLRKFRTLSQNLQTEILQIFDEVIEGIKSAEIKNWFLELRSIFAKAVSA